MKEGFAGERWETVETFVSDTPAKMRLVGIPYITEPMLAVVVKDEGYDFIQIWEQKSGFVDTVTDYPPDLSSEISIVKEATGVHDMWVEDFDQVEVLVSLARDMWRALNGKIEDAQPSISYIGDVVEEYNKRYAMGDGNNYRGIPDPNARKERDGKA